MDALTDGQTKHPVVVPTINWLLVYNATTFIRAQIAISDSFSLMLDGRTDRRTDRSFLEMQGRVYKSFIDILAEVEKDLDCF